MVGKMISVCMATFNGEKYIKCQLDSILLQLSSNDEVIVVDDCSQDETCQVIKSLWDNRIKLFINKINIGVNKSFEKSLKKARGDIIFLSDQDDLWNQRKVCEVIQFFDLHADVDLIQHDAEVVDENLKLLEPSFFKWRGHVGPEVIRNLIRDTHLGCCMVMRRCVLKDCLPITNIPYHDKWIGIMAVLTKHKMYFWDKVLIKYVRHEGTVTDKVLRHRSWSTILYERLVYVYEIIKFLKQK